jgi:hypothetical protein
MNLLSEEVRSFLFDPNSPKKAEVGKLYKLRSSPLSLDSDPLQLYVYDTQGRVTNQTWVPEDVNFVLVLKQAKDYTVVLSAEQIIRLAHDENGVGWRMELLPIKENEQ